jgi:hypothetical protein
MDDIKAFDIWIVDNKWKVVPDEAVKQSVKVDKNANCSNNNDHFFCCQGRR